MLSLKLWILIFSEIVSMFELWPYGDANPIVKSSIGLADVDLSLVFDGVCEVTGKIDFVWSVEVLNEMLLCVSEKLLLSKDAFSLT